MGLQDIGELIEADARQAVMEETWGHLAPVKNRTYKGRIVFAIGCYDSGDLNPTPLVCDLPGLSCSPWFYDAVNKWLQDLPDQQRRDGCVYEWIGFFRNYKFTGQVRLLLDASTK